MSIGTTLLSQSVDGTGPSLFLRRTIRTSVAHAGAAAGRDRFDSIRPYLNVVVGAVDRRVAVDAPKRPARSFQAAILPEALLDEVVALPVGLGMEVELSFRDRVPLAIQAFEKRGRGPGESERTAEVVVEQRHDVRRGVRNDGRDGRRARWKRRGNDGKRRG